MLRTANYLRRKVSTQCIHRFTSAYLNSHMDFQVGIIGAGFAGLVAALRLKKSGRNSFVVFERATEIGGTWRDNTYPGCACDVASPLYSFADEPNPNWSRFFSGQAEILQYMKGVVEKNGLEEHIRFDTEIISARFKEERGCWEVETADGRRFIVGMLILGLGPLNRPYIPSFKGLLNFNGKLFHSSEWDHTCTLAGKRVAVIGTGASAVQIIPAIAPRVERLVVFQRTPPWVTPRKDKKLSAGIQKRWQRFPILQKLLREKIYWLNELTGLGFLGNKGINRIINWVARRRLAKQVKDPELRKKLTPTYTIGCKRILTSNTYYPVFNQPNVTLVTDLIEKFVPEGIVANGVLHPLDVVVLATGFVAADIEVKVDIIGLNNRNLVDDWKRTGAEAYLGTAISGFPNLAFILGPNTGLGHNSVVHMMESQMNYVMGYLAHLEKENWNSYLDVKPEVQQQYNVVLQRELKGTVWNSGCKSWYLNRAGKNTTVFPRLTVSFRKLTKRFDAAAYQLVKTRSATFLKQNSASSK